MPRVHGEFHRTERSGWPRAAQLMAHDALGALAMAPTAGVGALFGTAVG